jgi:tetratricopeptide (TPR) repeat protein
MFIALMAAPLNGQIGDNYADAVRNFNLGRYKTAERKLLSMLDRNSECLECYDLLARIATATEEDSLAAHWYREASLVDPSNPELLQNLGSSAHRAGFFEEALSALEESIKLDSTLDKAYFELGNVWFDLKKLDKAEEYYLEALSRDSTVANYHFQIGMVYLETARQDSAIIEFQHTYQLYPKYTRAYELAASILIRQQRWPQVVEVLEGGLTSAAETPNTRYWLGGAYVEVGDFERAVEILSGYVVRNAEHIGARYTYGIALYETGDFPGASEHLSVVAQAKTDLLKAQLYWGKALVAIDQDSLAKLVLDTLIIRDPDYYEAWVERGDILRHNRDYPAALAHYRKAVGIDSGRWEAYHRQALTEYYKGQYLAAELLLINALSRNDSVAVIYEALGDVAAASDEDDFSIYYYNRTLEFSAVETEPVRWKLIKALNRMKIWYESERQLIYLVSQSGESERLLYTLGLVNQANSRVEVAADYFARYSELHDIRRERERLELRVALDSQNYRHHRILGDFYTRLEEDRLARDSYRRAVALGDSTLSASDYLIEGDEP